MVLYIFPSPLGVIFPLISGYPSSYELKINKFPSPLGVIFPLISTIKDSFKSKSKSFPSPLGVIFPLILKIKTILTLTQYFRLLSELYSLLLKRWINGSIKWTRISVSSRSYIPSYFEGFLDKFDLERYEFPSPLGVIFPLIPILKKTFVCNSL